MESSTRQTKWTAASAGDSIVIATADVRFDKRVRHAFRRQPYELLSITDFARCSEFLTKTACAIEFVNEYPAIEPTLHFKWANEYWSDYPLIGIYSKYYSRQWHEDPSNMCVMGPRYRDYDYYFTDPVSDEFLLSIAKRLIATSRNPDQDTGAYRI